MALYIDNLLIAAVTIVVVEELKKALHREFEMKNLGEVEVIIGIYIRRNRKARTLLINQSAYINELLEKEGISEYHSALIPMKVSRYGFLLHENQKRRADVNKYQRQVGKLMWLAWCSRFDIVFATARLSQYSSDPRQGHTEGVKHLLRYLRGASELALTYGGDPNGEKRELGGIGLVGYADSNYASES